jgi:predicted alpha/beta hydrolase
VARLSFAEIAAADGVPLAASVFSPDGRPASGAVVVASATGVPRGYYGRFASWLADQGLSAVTFDYRGIGGSRPASLRESRATMLDWARADLAGALSFAAARLEGRRPALVGHSFGGQALGLLPEPDAVSAALTVASQVGYFGLWPARHRPLLAALWFAFLPASTRALGYFPSRLFGMGESLPRGVALQWARWCRSRRWIWADPAASACASHARFRGPLRAYGIEDDSLLAPAPAVDALAALFTGASRVERIHLRPRDLGVARLGHWAFFRDGLRERLWPDAARFLSEAVAA